MSQANGVSDPAPNRKTNVEGLHVPLIGRATGVACKRAINRRSHAAREHTKAVQNSPRSR
jgi:hypothetical protein